MLLTITTTHNPATDLGYLLHKNPGRIHSVELAAGCAHLFYPEADVERCTIAILLDLDPVQLVRGRSADSAEGGLMSEYVNDRPYVASSFLSVALGRAFATALSGRSKERQELVDAPLPIEVNISSVPCKPGEPFLRGLFEPLGYTVECATTQLDGSFPDFGIAPYFSLTLRAEKPVREVLSHLYVLIPVLDDAKHYFVGKDEVEKLLRRGEGWLKSHPMMEVIAKRYLFHQRTLTDLVFRRLIEEEAPEVSLAEEITEPPTIEDRAGLDEQRIERAIGEVEKAGVSSVIDLGCGEGKTLRGLAKCKNLTKIVGVDVSHRALEAAHRKLKLDRAPERQKDRIGLFQTSLTYRDARLSGFDMALVMEVIEHLDPPRLMAFEQVVFGCAQPERIFLTTPNIEYNVRFENLPAGTLRHRDHRFEWTRAEFQAWAHGIAAKYSYDVELSGVGDVDPVLGAPTQCALFMKRTIMVESNTK
jgi:3' terminal RNA ribose 2'-O-methyltransferase Hen1